MTSNTPTTRSKEEMTPAAGLSGREPWRRQWGEPAVAGPIISSLVIALFGVGVVAFQSLKDDITTLRDDIRATETRLVADMKGLGAELKADNRALRDKLDQVLENLRP